MSYFRLLVSTLLRPSVFAVIACYTVTPAMSRCGDLHPAGESGLPAQAGVAHGEPTCRPRPLPGPPLPVHPPPHTRILPRHTEVGALLHNTFCKPSAVDMCDVVCF